MKKTSFLILCFLLGLGLARAQNAVANFKMTLRQGTEYHSLGEGATVLLKDADNLKLNDLLLLTADIKDTVRLQASNESFQETYTYTERDEDNNEIIKTGTRTVHVRDTIKSDRKYIASIPSDFYLGTGRMKKAGITADGMMFFSASDSIRPHSDKWDDESVYKLKERGIYNYIYFALLNVKSFNSYSPNDDATVPAPLFATENTKIGYETNGDTLFIGYENIRMVGGTGSETNSQTVSWNYQINLKTGEIGLQTKGFFQTTGSKNDSLPTNMKWGFVTDDKNNTAWLYDFKGVSQIKPGMGSFAVRMGKNPAGSFDRPVENAVYQFVLPAACVEVNGAQITWSDDILVTDSKINLKKETIWTNGQKALFVLSKHSTLEGENLPLDGTLYVGGKSYATAVPLGDGQAMVAQMLAPGSENEDWHNDLTNFSSFENLEASTTYYVHTFVFNDTCSNGPLYGKPLAAKKINTLLAKAGDIKVKDIKTNSMKVVLPKADENLQYIIAWAEKPLTKNKKNLSGVLKNGTVYTEGQEVVYTEEGYDGNFTFPFTIAKVGVVDSAEISNLRNGKGYYIMVWLMRSEEGEISYSSDYSGATARTSYSLPAAIDFVGEEVSKLPIGWETSTYDYNTFDETMKPIVLQKPHFCIQYTTTTGGEILSAFLNYDRDLDNDNLVKAHIISPWFDEGDAERIQSSFRIRFFSMIGESILPYAVRPGDSVIFSWQQAGDEEWTRLGICNDKTEYSSTGHATIELPFFKPKKDFRYRLDYYHESSEDDLTAAYFSIDNISVDAFEYQAVTDLHTTDLKKDSVTINWKGEADEYRLFWKERASEGEYNEVGTEELSYTITGLKPKTQYAYYVYGIYGGEKGKESDVKYFTTLSVVLDTVKTPVFSVIPGMVDKGTEVSILCATDNATIYYTTDGSTPTTGSTVYEKAIVIESDVTIKAFAVKSGMADSKVAEAAYTVKVANEGDVLAAVKLYPNPTDGLFHVVVPEAATVEVFSASGTLVERLNVAAGQTALRLNQSGMYFVKVSIGNQFAIRKVVVR